MVQIERGRLLGCKDSIGGVDKVYLFSYEKHLRSQIVIRGNELIAFPPTDIYDYEFANKPTFSNDGEINDGGEFFKETLDLDFAKIKVYEKFEKFLKADLRCIVKDNNGNYKLLGAYKGIECEKIQITTGSAKSDLNGYKVSLKGMEEQPSLFISNLETAGFTVQPNNWLQLETGEYLLTEDNDLINI